MEDTEFASRRQDAETRLKQMFKLLRRSAMFFAFVSLLAASPAQERWHPEYGNDDLSVDIDKNQITHSLRGTYRLWLRYSFISPQRDDPVGEYDTQLADAEARCSSLEYRFLALHRYHAQQLVHSFPQNPNEPWQKVIPETTGEGIWKATCRDLTGALAPFIKQEKRPSGNPVRH